MSTSSPVTKKQKIDHNSNDAKQKTPESIIEANKPERLQCHFVLVHKGGRRCKMTRPSWSNFCSQHQDVNTTSSSGSLVSEPSNDNNNNKNNTDNNKRVPCPLDPNHTVRESQLQRHIKKCPKAKAPPKDVWFNLDMNIVNKGAFNSVNNDNDKTFKTSPEYYQHMEKVLEKVWETVLNKQDPELQVLSHPGLDSRLSELEKPKHAIQQSSLIGHMKNLGLLDVINNDSNNSSKSGKNPITIEFGCGRAELSRYVSRAHFFSCSEDDDNPTTISTNDNNNTDQSSTDITRPFLLVDRAGPRMKFDSKLEKDYNEEQEEKGKKRIGKPVVKRVLIDIKDLDLYTALETQFGNHQEKKQEEKEERQIVAISKHLCGCATDLTLECLRNCCQVKSQENDSNNKYSLKGLVIALCCRHICSFETYPAIDFLFENGLISKEFPQESFKAFVRMTSWVVNGRRENMKDETEENAFINSTGLSIKQREKMGLIARRCIDYGRVLALKRYYSSVKLVQYVQSDVSLENVALLVKL